MHLSLDQWLQLIQFGLSTASSIHAALASGKHSVTLPTGAVVTGAEAVAALDGAIAAALGAGDAAADRIVGRAIPIT